MSKCFTSLNGYTVKDAKARERIEVIERVLSTFDPEASNEPKSYVVETLADLPSDAVNGSIGVVSSVEGEYNLYFRQEGEWVYVGIADNKEDVINEPLGFIVSSTEELPNDVLNGSIGVVETTDGDTIISLYIRENGEWVYRGVAGNRVYQVQSVGLLPSNALDRSMGLVENVATDGSFLGFDLYIKGAWGWERRSVVNYYNVDHVDKMPSSAPVGSICIVESTEDSSLYTRENTQWVYKGVIGTKIYNVQNTSQLPSDAPQTSLALIENVATDGNFLGFDLYKKGAWGWELRSVLNYYNVDHVDKMPSSAPDGSICVVDTQVMSVPAKAFYNRVSGQWVYTGDINPRIYRVPLASHLPSDALEGSLGIVEVTGNDGYFYGFDIYIKGANGWTNRTAKN